MERTLRQIAKYLGYEISEIDESHHGSRFPVEATFTERKFIEIARQFSSVGRLRLWNIVQAFRHVESQLIPGDFVECGVKKGGSLILLQNLINHRMSARSLYGFDIFDDPELKPNELEVVKKNIEKNVLKPNFRLIGGPVETTLTNEENLPESIAILKIDTDWYERTKVELETLYPRLSEGGVLIIDAYGRFKGCKKAVDDYFGNDLPWLHYVDQNCRLLIKE